MRLLEALLKGGCPGLLVLTACAGAVGQEPSMSEAPPAESETLDEWLQAGGHLGWQSWSEVGPTLGSGGARVYLSASLVNSLDRAEPTHPPGAAAVRELYADDFTTLTGYSALIKVDTVGDAESWFCFERLSLEADAEVHVAERGSPGCAGCHGQGHDFVRSTLPLP